jgi:hypothetical protein
MSSSRSITQHHRSWHYAARSDSGHAGKIGFRTQIGNDCFSWLGTGASKSRLNFLDHRIDPGDQPVTRRAYRLRAQ